MLGILTWDLGMLHYMIHDLVLLEMKMSKIRMNYHVANQGKRVGILTRNNIITGFIK